MTRCPICQTAGAEFPLAEYAPAVAPLDATGGVVDEVLLMCPTCDEAFHPRFYQRCELCGYRFAGGLDTDEKPPELAGRALWVLTGILALVCVLGLYFWAVLAR